MSIPLDKILEAAKRSGFDAELKVASALSAKRWTATQSVYYLDNDEKKGRELDCYAYRIFYERDTKPEVNCHINFCIEVKKTECPFMFFSSSPGVVEPGRGFATINWLNRIDNKILPYKSIERRKPLGDTERIARSYCSFKDNKTDQIKGGILSALKGALHYKTNCNERESDVSHDICFFVPMLVVDGEIYECYFETGSAELKAQRVETLVYMQHYLSEHYGKVSNRVVVTTLDHLPVLLEEYEDWGLDMLQTLEARRSLYGTCIEETST